MSLNIEFCVKVSLCCVVKDVFNSKINCQKFYQFIQHGWDCPYQLIPESDITLNKNTCGSSLYTSENLKVCYSLILELWLFYKKDKYNKKAGIRS